MPNETKFRPKGKKSITIDISDSENESLIGEPQNIEIEPKPEEPTRPEFNEDGKRISYNKNGKPRKKMEGCSEARLASLQKGRETRARNLALKKQAKLEVAKPKVEEELNQ